MGVAASRRCVRSSARDVCRSGRSVRISGPGPEAPASETTSSKLVASGPVRPEREPRVFRSDARAITPAQPCRSAPLTSSAALARSERRETPWPPSRGSLAVWRPWSTAAGNWGRAMRAPAARRWHQPSARARPPLPACVHTVSSRSERSASVSGAPPPARLESGRRAAVAHLAPV